MEERTGTGITPERSGLSELEKRQDQGMRAGERPAGEAGGTGATESSVGAAGTGAQDSSLGSGTVTPGRGSQEEGEGTGKLGALQERGREHAERIRGLASGRIRRSLDGRKSYFASELDSFAGLFEDVSRTLEERGRGDQKKIADSAASVTRRASRLLRERSTDEIIDNVRSGLKERPAVVFAGALALGFLGVRFLRD